MTWQTVRGNLPNNFLRLNQSVCMLYMQINLSWNHFFLKLPLSTVLHGMCPLTNLTTHKLIIIMNRPHLSSDASAHPLSASSLWVPPPQCRLPVGPTPSVPTPSVPTTSVPAPCGSYLCSRRCGRMPRAPRCWRRRTGRRRPRPGSRCRRRPRRRSPPVWRSLSLDRSHILTVRKESHNIGCPIVLYVDVLEELSYMVLLSKGWYTLWDILTLGHFRATAKKMICCGIFVILPRATGICLFAIINKLADLVKQCQCYTPPGWH